MHFKKRLKFADDYLLISVVFPEEMTNFSMEPSLHLLGIVVSSRAGLYGRGDILSDMM